MNKSNRSRSRNHSHNGWIKTYIDKNQINNFQNKYQQVEKPPPLQDKNITKHAAKTKINEKKQPYSNPPNRSKQVLQPLRPTRKENPLHRQIKRNPRKAKKSPSHTFN